MINKNILLGSLLLCTGLSTKAQFFIGGGIALNSYRNMGMYPAVQPRLGLDYKEGKVSIIAGFNFSPFQQSNTFNITYASQDGTEKTTIPFTEKIAINNAFIHGCYRIGSSENALRPKLIFGASGDFINVKYTSTRKAKPGLIPSEEVKNGSATGPKVDLGVGFDFRANEQDDFNVELLLALPANNVNGQYIYNPTVAHFGLTLTYSHYFGKRDYAEW